MAELERGMKGHIKGRYANEQEAFDNLLALNPEQRSRLSEDPTLIGPLSGGTKPDDVNGEYLAAASGSYMRAPDSQRREAASLNERLASPQQQQGLAEQLNQQLSQAPTLQYSASL